MIGTTNVYHSRDGKNFDYVAGAGSAVHGRTDNLSHVKIDLHTTHTANIVVGYDNPNVPEEIDFEDGVFTPGGTAAYNVEILPDGTVNFYSYPLDVIDGAAAPVLALTVRPVPDGNDGRTRFVVTRPA